MLTKKIEKMNKENKLKMLNGEGLMVNEQTKDNLPFTINNLPLNKVEWKTLGEVADYEQPTKYLVQSTNYSDKYKTPVLTAGKTFILGYTDEKIGIREASKSPIILFDDFTSANRWIDFDFKVKSSATKIITAKNENEVIAKYIYYMMQTMQNVEVYAAEHKRLWISNFSQIKIPIPPLKIQQEKNNMRFIGRSC